MSIHPREVEPHAEEFRKNLKDADLVHFTYWRTASQLVKLVPELAKKPNVLTHHNEKNLLSEPWGWVDKIIVPTRYCESIINKHYPDKAYYIPYGIDLDQFYYNTEYPKVVKGKEKIRIGYVGRFVKWKRLRNIVQACGELGYAMLVIGKPDDRGYQDEIRKTIKKYKVDIDYRTDVADKDMQGIYSKMTVYVQNCWSNRETGPLPMLEAMAVGVPVLSTPAGHAMDFGKDKENMILLDFNNPTKEDSGDEANVVNIKNKLKVMVEDVELRKRLRSEAWNTVKGLPKSLYAFRHDTAYNEVLYPRITNVEIQERDDMRQCLASVIVPAYNNKDNVIQILEAVKEQTYENIEVLVCDDNSDDGLMEAVYDWREENNVTVKYVNTKRNGYNLAMARNLGVIESAGEYLIFCDSRFKPTRNAVEKFVKAITYWTPDEKIWVWGNKGQNSGRAFVENFSCIRRRHLIDAGMFNERIDEYGGMSQELRVRFERQGFELGYDEAVKAEQINRSSKDSERRKSIVRMKAKLWKMGLYK